MRSIARNPKASYFVLIEAADAGGDIFRAQESAAGGLERLLAAAVNSNGRVVAPRHLMTGIVAGVTRVARMTVLTGDADRLPGLADDVADWITALPQPALLSLRSIDAGPRVPRASARSGSFPRLQLADGFAYGEVRTRVYNVVTKLVFEGGLAALDVGRIRAEAGISRREFDARFTGVDQCLVASAEAFAESTARRAGSYAGGERSPQRGVHRVVRTLCGSLTQDRRLVRRTIVGVRTAGREGLIGKDRLITRTARRLTVELEGRGTTSILRSEASVAAAWKLCEGEIEAGRATELSQSAPFLTYFVLAPAVGPEAALKAIAANRARE